MELFLTLHFQDILFGKNKYLPFDIILNIFFITFTSKLTFSSEEYMADYETLYREQPLVTFALFTYNQSSFVMDAVEGALSQTYPRIEFIFSDDASSDNTFELMSNLVDTHPRAKSVNLIKNTHNLGIIKHLNKVLNIAKGELVILAAGDDISLPNRTEYIVSKYIKLGRTEVLIHSSVIKINNDGDPQGDWIPDLIVKKLTYDEISISENLYIGASGAISSGLMRSFSPIFEYRVYEDRVYGFRAALLNGLEYIDTPLIRYRVGDGISTRTSSNPKFFLRKFVNWKNKQAIYLALLRQRYQDLKEVEHRTPHDNLHFIFTLSKEEAKNYFLNFKIHSLFLLFLTNPKSVLLAFKELMGLVRLHFFKLLYYFKEA